MKTRWFVIIAALAAACGSSKKEPQPPTPTLAPPDAAVAAVAPPPAAASTCDDLPAAIDRVIKAQLAEVPPDKLADAKAVVDKVVPQITGAMVESCKTDAWSPEATTCMATGKASSDWDACTGKFTPAQQQSLQGRLTQAMASVQPPPAPPKTYDLAPDTGIKECDAYLKTIAVAVGCDKLDADSRDQIQTAADVEKKQWVSMPKKTAKEKKAIVDSCKASMKGLKEASKSAGCPL